LQVAREYERLKFELAANYANDRVAYTNGKLFDFYRFDL